MHRSVSFRIVRHYRSLKYAAPTELAAFDIQIGYKYVAPKELDLLTPGFWLLAPLLELLLLRTRQRRSESAERLARPAFF
jgi:hypothetical protein